MLISITRFGLVCYGFRDEVASDVGDVFGGVWCDVGCGLGDGDGGVGCGCGGDGINIVNNNNKK